MELSCCVWALDNLSLDEEATLQQMRALGFDSIDLQPGHLRDSASRKLAHELGLKVSCVGASFGMPAGAALDHESMSLRRLARRHIGDAIDHAADLGATTAYLVPGKDRSRLALQRFGDALASLAEAAASRDIKLALEHFPGAALPSAKATLDFIRDIGHPNLYLLYDSGHIQISGEDPARAIDEAADRLAYAHFDDNDGERDLHLGLLDGVMTEADLKATIAALKNIGYAGALSLELSPQLPDPFRALRKGRDLLMRAMHD